MKNKESFLNELNETEGKYNEFLGLNFSYEEWNQLQIDQKFLANGKELIGGINKCISIIDEGDISLKFTFKRGASRVKKSSCT